MNETAPKEPQNAKGAPSAKLDINADERLRYIGFDVGPKKIGSLYKSPAEEEKFVRHIHEKHDHHDVFRDTSNFREERIGGGERIALIAASLVVLLTFFMPFAPMISGYIETRTEVPVTPSADAEPTAPATETATEETDATGAAEEGGEADGVADLEAAEAEADDAAAESATRTSSAGAATGFQDVQGARTRTKIEKTPFRWSGLQLLTDLGSYSGALFSSGIFVILSAVVFGLYLLCCLLIPAFVLMKVFTLKGSPDDVALQLKAALKLGWLPLILLAVLIGLSLAGGDYGADTSAALKQLGDEYSIAALLGLLGPGFFVSLGGFIVAGAKSAEI